MRRGLWSVVVSFAAVVGVVIIPAGPVVANGCGVDFVGETYHLKIPQDFEVLHHCSSDWDYVLMNNIDLTGTNPTLRDDFTGTFDGNGFTISNLSITGSGLFDVGAGGATFTDVTLEDAVVTGGGGNGWAGALVREAYGPVTITGSSFSGTITAGSDGNDWVGGFVGNAGDDVTIIDSYVLATVTGGSSNGWAGGFIGSAGLYSAGTTTLERNYMIGSIQGGSGAGGNVWAAGFIGANIAGDTSITDSFVRGDVAGGSAANSWANGFVGDHFTSNLNISGSYFEGTLTEGSGPNAWASAVYQGGPGASGSEIFCVEDCGDYSFSGDDIASLAALRAAVDDADWDFSNTWCYSYGHNDGYPVLRGLTHGPNAAWGNCMTAPVPPAETTTTTTTTPTTVACQVAPIQTGATGAALQLKPGSSRVVRGGVVVKSGVEVDAVTEEGSLRVRGTGLASGVSVDAWLVSSGAYLGTLTTDSAGLLRGRLTVPAQKVQVDETLQLVERTCNTVTLVVSLGVSLGGLGSLPGTGNDSTYLIWFGFIAVALGEVIRRRRTI